MGAENLRVTDIKAAEETWTDTGVIVLTVKLNLMMAQTGASRKS